MATVNRFEDLIVWQRARELDKMIFRLTLKEKIKGDFELIRQWRRSCGSVMDNIAEGFDRQGNREFVQFLSIARGSLGEVQSQCLRASDRGYIEELEFKMVFDLTREVKLLLDKLMQYIKSSKMRGLKFSEKDPKEGV